MFLRTLFLAAMAALAFAQAPAATEPKKASVEGVVVNALTGEPLRRAQVVLRQAGAPGGVVGGAGGPMIPRSPGLAATTDAAGKFALANVDAGKYLLSAERNGFLRGEYGAKRAGRPGTSIDVQAGAVKRDLTIKLTPQGIVAGHVFDDEGEPLQNVFVQVLQKRYLRGAARLMPSAAGTTNDRGEFRVLDVQPGRYVVIARQRVGMPDSPADNQTELGFAPTYYPGVTNGSQAGIVEVSAGHESGGLDMRLQRARLFRIRGQVVDAAGAPAKQVMVQALPRDNPFAGGLNNAFVRDNDGRVDLANLPPGSYTLVARSMGSGREGGAPSMATQTVEVGERNIEGLVVTLTPGVTVNGTIAVEGGGAVKLDSLHVSLMPSMLMMSGGDGAAKGDGTFSIPNISPGAYRINVAHPGVEAYVKSVKIGGQEVDDQEVEISAAAPEVVVTLSTAAGKVTGTVNSKDGPISQARVVLMPADQAKRRETTARVAMTPQDGTFTFGGLAPGEYKVFAWEDVESGAWLDPEFLKPLESKGADVKVQAGGNAALNLDVIPAGQ